MHIWYSIWQKVTASYEGHLHTTMAQVPACAILTEGTFCFVFDTNLVIRVITYCGPVNAKISEKIPIFVCEAAILRNGNISLSPGL